MADAIGSEEDVEPKFSKSGLLVGLVLAVVGGGAGFFMTSSGLLNSSGATASPTITEHGFEFVPIDPITVPIGRPSEQRFLRFRAELEVQKGHATSVQAMMPRVVDVLNTYLRSITMADLEDPASMLTLRGQMRRRVDLVVGGDKVNDLLVMEFVVN